MLIAGRPYKLKVTPEEEIYCADKQAEKLNDKVQQLSGVSFTSKDKQDFLAMIALQQRVDLLKHKAPNEDQSEWLEKIEALDKLLSDNIKV
jgi:hypothetical protein